MVKNRTERLYDAGILQDRDADYVRTSFERDRERLVHTRSLRRLAGVTQVVNAAEGQVFHNRLTHTLKVAQIARRLGARLLRVENPRLINKLGGLDVDVVEAAALAHDLGHPPFGHTGEDQLHTLVREQGADGYEGNAQSFRIVNKLEVRWTGFGGLNLTRATLNALLKYPWTRAQQPENSARKKEKWGAYSSERWELDWVRRGSDHLRQSLEASIMDWADDIAYAIHDMDDFYRAGLIPLDHLVTEATIQINYSGSDTWERSRFLEAVTDWRKGDGVDYTPDKIIHTFDTLLSLFPLSQPYRAAREQERTLQIVIEQLINRYIKAVTLNPDAVDDASLPLLCIPIELVREVKILKDLTRYYVINSRALGTQQYGEKQIIQFLFACYMEEALALKRSRGKVVQSILPSDFDTLIHEAEEYAEKRGDGYSDDVQRRARVVADVISRMTDDQALRMHQRLSGTQPGSLADLLA
ncbi:MAG: dNTP triphosphohydrolase [Anaerolineae bacterium]